MLPGLLGGLIDAGTNNITASNVNTFVSGKSTHGFELGSGVGPGVILAISTDSWNLQIDYGTANMAFRIHNGNSWSVWHVFNAQP